MAAAADTLAVRVLVVDDDRDAAEMMALLLGLEGHEVATAYDGASSISKVLSFQPNLVLLDIGMPELDGYDVARRIQTLPLSPRPLLVAVTGYASLDDTRRSAEAGFDLHVRKPVFPDVFEGLAQVLQLSTGTVRRARELTVENRQAVTSLMLQHLEMANLYLDAALATIITDVRLRWIAKAQKAHDKVATWLNIGACDEMRRAEVVEALEELRQRLPT
jgi:CheY-like chemotaxis protein